MECFLPQSGQADLIGLADCQGAIDSRVADIRTSSARVTVVVSSEIELRLRIKPVMFI